QEIFLRIWLSRHLLNDVENPGSWINGIASHVSYSWLRSRIKQRTLVTGITDSRPADIHEPPVYIYDLQRLVANAIDRLSPQRKKVYTLSRDKGMTIPEIADDLKLSPSTVKNTLVAALSEIREQLKFAGYELPAIILAWLIGQV
ncbi:MAG: sigma-70 family RNA polymerase sigma factor, partial [Chitinophagaceae bacterium]|nr:sigma-70 family RNA polymerase sigma factor [Chitinophagaceae bacterium]